MNTYNPLVERLIQALQMRYRANGGKVSLPEADPRRVGVMFLSRLMTCIRAEHAGDEEPEIAALFQRISHEDAR